MISDNIKKLCSNINFIFDKEKNIKYTGKFKPVLYKHIYSSSKESTIRVENNGHILPIKGVVSYKCPNCSIINEILLKRFLQKDTIKCRRCRENDDIKRKKQSDYIKKSFYEFGKVTPKDKKEIKNFKQLTNDELINLSSFEFDNESDEFKNNYFIKNITEEEFLKIKDKIKIKNLDINKVIFYPYIKTTHSHKYSPKIMDEKGNFHLLYNLTYICDSCGSEFNGRNIKNKAIQYKILCKDCYLCNRTFKIRKIKNIRNEIVRYQSTPELNLINYCNYNSILIENGPKIEYIFNGEKMNYKVDFKVKNILIEIKDNHIWHKKEVESGKWFAKESAAIEYCKNNKLEYKLIMKSDIKRLYDHILKYHWVY
jgi:DNA-directed RNA polymerase subunit RPC12/RpoP